LAADTAARAIANARKADGELISKKINALCESFDGGVRGLNLEKELGKRREHVILSLLNPQMDGRNKRRLKTARRS